MSLALNFSIIGIVVAFLVSALGSLPFSDSAIEPSNTIDESYSTEAVHQMAGLFSNSYTSLIDELISYQKDPDYARAESRRQQTAEVGASLVGDFQGLASRLERKLGDVTSQSGEQNSTPAD